MNWDAIGAVGEIVGALAVVVSLIFVVYSINRNSAMMQASNDNFLFELQLARIRNLLNSPGMASIYAKRNRNEELTEEDHVRLMWDQMMEVGVWEIAFIRYRDGLFSSKQWDSWNNYFVDVFTKQFSAESWAEVRDWVPEDFRDHVDDIYARKLSED